MAVSQPGASSIAGYVGVGAKNVQFLSEAQNVPRKGVIIGTYDETTKTEIVENQPYLVTSEADVGDKFGFGFMVYRLAKAWFLGAGGIETWVIPQKEATTPGYAQGSITVTVTTAEAGTIYLYIAGESVQVSVADGDSDSDIATAIETAINADTTLPVKATAALGVVTIDANSAGPWGNYVNLSDSWGFGEELPAGVTLAYVQPTGGTGVPDIQDALDAIGIDDEQNSPYFTELLHGYMQDSTTLDTLSAWNGVGNDFVGNYGKIVARPLRSLGGDTAVGSGGLSSLITLGDGRKQDRTQGILAAPGSPNHPQEIAGQALGIEARINNTRAAEHYTGKPLIGVIPGDAADRWTSSYTNRDTALKSGISSTKFDGSSLILQDIATFYHPDNVLPTSNGYALQVNISKIQNVTNSVKLNFQQEKWQGVFIVADVSTVTNTVDNQKARDKQAVENDIIALARSWQSHGWIYDAEFTIDRIKTGNYVQTRAGNTGFDITIPILLSGAGRIYDSTVEFDTSISILNG
jgi:phage tail sheath gpL-like